MAYYKFTQTGAEIQKVLDDVREIQTASHSTTIPATNTLAAWIKNYVDEHSVSDCVKKSGDTMTGNLNMDGHKIDLGYISGSGYNYLYSDKTWSILHGSIGVKLNAGGGAELALSASNQVKFTFPNNISYSLPTNGSSGTNYTLATQEYVDAHSGGNYLPLSGGKMTGPITGGDYGSLTLGGQVVLENDVSNITLGTSDIEIQAGNMGHLTIGGPFSNSLKLGYDGITFDNIVDYGDWKRGYYKFPIEDGSTSDNRYTIATQEYVDAHSGGETTIPVITIASEQQVAEAGQDVSSGHAYLTLRTTAEQQAILENLNNGIIKIDLSAIQSAYQLPVPYLWIKKNTINVLQGLTLIQYSFDNSGFEYGHALTNNYIVLKEIGTGGAIYESTNSKELFISFSSINPTIMWTRIGDCEKVIPAEASQTNKLADKAYVDEHKGTQLYKHRLQYESNAYEIVLISTSGTPITRLFASSFTDVVSGTYRDHGTTYPLFGVYEPGPEEANAIYLNQLTITQGTLDVHIPESSDIVTKL